MRAILLIVIAVMIYSCGDTSRKREHPRSPTVTTPPKVEKRFQVMYDDGRIENVDDIHNILFAPNDTVVVLDYFAKIRNSYISGKHVYGKYIHDKFPKSLYTDTSYYRYYKAVIRRVVL